MSNAAMIICVPVFVWTYIFSSFRCIPRRIFKIKCLRDRLFQSSCTILHSHWQCVRVLISPHFLHYMFSCVFVILATLTGILWHLSVVLICFSLMINHSEHLFILLFGYLHIFFGEVSIKMLSPFLVGFLLLSIRGQDIPGIKLLIEYMIGKYCLLFFSFTFFMVSFEAQTFLILIKSNLLFFSFLLVF